MEPTPGLVDELYRAQVLRARASSPAAKFAAGPSLFEDVCERMAAGLRMENPSADEATIRELLRLRLDRLRKLRDSHDRQ
jgi:hypothetical protein